MPAATSTTPMSARWRTARAARCCCAVLPYPDAVPAGAARAALAGKPLRPLLRRTARRRRAARRRCSTWRRASFPARSRHDGAARLPAPRAQRRGRVAMLSGCAQPVLQPAHQRGRHPAAQPARRRGGAAEGRGLLRRARPSHGPRRQRARLRPAQHRRLDARDRRRGARRHRDHRLGLRHDGQGLRLHVPRRSRLCREGASASPRWREDITEYVSSLELAPRSRADGRRRRLPLGLLDAARPEDHGRAQAAAEGGWASW